MGTENILLPQPRVDTPTFEKLQRQADDLGVPLQAHLQGILQAATSPPSVDTLRANIEAWLSQTAHKRDEPIPNRGLFDSSTVHRINSTAHKIGQAFHTARIEASSEALWLAEQCRALLRDNDRLRVEIEDLQTKIRKSPGANP